MKPVENYAGSCNPVKLIALENDLKHIICGFYAGGMCLVCPSYHRKHDNDSRKLIYTQEDLILGGIRLTPSVFLQSSLLAHLYTLEGVLHHDFLNTFIIFWC